MSGPSIFLGVWNMLERKSRVEQVLAILDTKTQESQGDPSSLPSRPQNMSNLVWACATVMYKDEAPGEKDVFHGHPQMVSFENRLAWNSYGGSLYT